MKKDKLNAELFQANIQGANEGGEYWFLIADNINNKIWLDMSNKYKTVDRKLNRLIDRRDTKKKKKIVDSSRESSKKQT
jgi:hypothetical protein